MSPETKTTITLELVLDGEGLSGRAAGGSGMARDFSGRLGLMHAIDELLATEANGSHQDKDNDAAPSDGVQ